jgi:predicted transcriptional regulator
MGTLADTLRDVALPLDKKNQVLALDREFEDLKASERRVIAANVKLQAGAFSDERTPALAKDETGHGEDSVADITEKILAIISNSEIPKDSIIKSTGLTTATGDRHIDVLLGKQYIVQSKATIAGVFYRATAEGRAYLARNNNS